MNGDSRIERTLPLILEDLGRGTAPDYVDSLLGRTEAMRQRPGWTFIERWLPMSALSQRLATAPGVPLRTVALLALLIIALAAAAIYIGTQRRLPDPFGPAGNGVISYASNGDIYVGDVTTGATRLLVGGPENDAAPGFSPDGTRIAFLRETGSNVALLTAAADGSGVREIAAYPAVSLAWANWAPDSQRIAVIHRVEYSGAGCAVSFCLVNQLDLVDATHGGSVQRLASAAGMAFAQFRPPDGREIMYRALVDGKFGLFVMNADGTNVRTIVAPTVSSEMDFSFLGAVYSADGSRIFYQHGDATGCCRLWVVNADGTDDHEFLPLGPAWDGEAVVSPDGTRVAYWHNANDGPSHGVFVVRADGTGPVIETGPKLTGTAHWAWAPDSSKILMYPNDVSNAKAYLLDPAGGPWTTVPWGSDGDIDWQRVAPH